MTIRRLLSTPVLLPLDGGGWVEVYALDERLPNVSVRLMRPLVANLHPNPFPSREGELREIPPTPLTERGAG